MRQVVMAAPSLAMKIGGKVIGSIEQAKCSPIHASSKPSSSASTTLLDVLAVRLREVASEIT